MMEFAANVHQITRPVDIRWLPVRAEQKPYPIIGFFPIASSDAKPCELRVEHAAAVIQHRFFKIGQFAETSARLELAIFGAGSAVDFWRGVPGFIEVAVP